MPLEIWLAFVVTSAAVLVIPGPSMLTVIGYALAHGRRSTFPLVLGGFGSSGDGDDGGGH